MIIIDILDEIFIFLVSLILIIATTSPSFIDFIFLIPSISTILTISLDSIINSTYFGHNDYVLKFYFFVFSFPLLHWFWSLSQHSWVLILSSQLHWFWSLGSHSWGPLILFSRVMSFLSFYFHWFHSSLLGSWVQFFIFIILISLVSLITIMSLSSIFIFSQFH